MLELKNIVKDYVSGNNVTHALKGISVNFRKSEFVSILGASGCGKTTTLNIIGGLDRYTEGDLIINGKSTKNYTDRDWDTYRNHSIGFIFQSYNLISHQNILKNVELALTISGVDKEERKQRALKALEIVGLKGMEKKKPNQLSGGQCQRVAIARALINNPEILLADEPTGALDSETSVQIMDLLKEVAKDRLVIMVTHNPDLAKKYSTRIITMSDGVLLKDSNPFDGKEKVSNVVVNKGKKKKSSMSVFTAAGLSLSNLFSKIKRTILVTVAGSIGIIGVSAVLAVSQGVRDFISGMQNDMLSSYPLSITEESVDYTSLMTGLNAATAGKALEFDPTTQVGVDSMINYLMTAYSGITSVRTNTIDQNLVDYIKDIPQDAVAATFMNYGIDVTNNIFGNWKQNENDEGKITSLNGLTQSYISELQTVKGFSSYASYVNLFTNFMNELPDSKSYITDQYDIIAGSTLNLDANDLVLVVDSDTTLTDLLLAEMGVYNHDEFLRIAKKAIKENEIRHSEITSEEKNAALEELNNDVNYQYHSTFELSELINREYVYYPHDTIYAEKGKVADAEKSLSFITVVNDNEGKFERVIYLTATYNDETSDIAMMTGLEFYMNDEGPQTEIIVAVKYMPDANPVTKEEDLINGTWIALTIDNATKLNGDSINMMEVLQSASFALRISGSGSSYSKTPMSPMSYKTISPKITLQTTEVNGYHFSAVAETNWTNKLDLKISAILRLKESKNFGCLSRGLYYTNALAEKYMNDARESNVVLDMKNHIETEAQLGAATEYKTYVTFDYNDWSNNDDVAVIKQGYANSLNGDLSSSFGDLFSALTGVNYEETNTVHLRSLSGLKTTITRSDDKVVASFDPLPQKIEIYPVDFAAKDRITDYLNKWNTEENVLVNGAPLEAKYRDPLTYRDTIQLIITVITTLIDAITIALVAFSSLSLVVSCFMIAVITYISIVERIKEIGVIRSLGGRKGDVANLFIMETLLTGLFSGGFGIGMTYLFQVIFNFAMKAEFGITIANLTPWTALIMIGVSVLLSVVSGLIPSQSAARKDPVVALRSNE